MLILYSPAMSFSTASSVLNTYHRSTVSAAPLQEIDWSSYDRRCTVTVYLESQQIILQLCHHSHEIMYLWYKFYYTSSNCGFLHSFSTMARCLENVIVVTVLRARKHQKNSQVKNKQYELNFTYLVIFIESCS